MPAGAGRRAVRIALSMAVALCLAESDPDRVQLSFLAPLMAAAITTGGAPPAAALLVLPPLVWAICVAMGLALQGLHGVPVALGVLLFGVFLAGFRLSTRPRLALPGALMLIAGAVVPTSLVAAPGLAGDVARWIATNVAIAAVAVLLVRLVLPEAVGEREEAPRIAPLPPLAAAGALLGAVALVALVRPEASAAFLISVVLALRADVLPPGEVMRARLGGALVGGAAAWLAWKVIGLAPSMPVLFALVLLVAWWLAGRALAGGREGGVFLKGLFAFAILLGEGFSAFFEEADERFAIRLGAVVLGLLYAAAALWLLAPRPAIRPGCRARLNRATALPASFVTEMGVAEGFRTLGVVPRAAHRRHPRRLGTPWPGGAGTGHPGGVTRVAAACP